MSIHPNAVFADVTHPADKRPSLNPDGQRSPQVMRNCCALVIAALLPQQPTTPTPSATVTPPSGPLLDLSIPGQLWFVGIVSLVLVILFVAATVYDVRTASRLQEERLTLLGKLVDKSALTPTDAAAIGRSLNRPARGVQGLTRSLIALSILAVIGLAVAAAMVSPAADASDLRRTLLSP